jgi:TonB family protein
MQRQGARPKAESSGGGVFPGAFLEEKPIWSELYECIRDALFPPKLPPLELTSRPVPVVDRVAAKTNPWAIGTSTFVNGGILALMICVGLNATIRRFSGQGSVARVELSDWKLFAPQNTGTNRGGGGGGDEVTAPIEGRPPKVEPDPITPPQLAVLDRPRLATDAAIAAPPDVKLPENAAMPNLGVGKSYNVSLASSGPGLHGGIGTGAGGGVGPGNGPGWGLGSENGVYVPGRAGVTPPIPIVAPEAEFSDEARQQKYQGICLVSLIVDARGFPQNLHVVRRLGMGLDEKAMEAIGKYRFRPAMKDGMPVASLITVEVDFRLF